MIILLIIFSIVVVALTTAQSLDGEWVGQLPVLGHVFVAKFSGSSVTISVPQLKLTNTANFTVQTMREPFVVTVPETNCYLQPFRGSTLRAIWKLNGDASQLTIAVRTMDCVSRLPESFEMADGVLIVVARRRSGVPTPAPPTPPPTPERPTPAPSPLRCPANYTTMQSFRRFFSEYNEWRQLPQCICSDGRIGPECSVCTRNADCNEQRLSNDTSMRCQTDPLTITDGGQWYCAVVADPAIEQFVRLNRTRVTVAYANGTAEVILWESELGMPRKFTCAATGCRASRLGGADSVVCDETLCWCEHAIGCNPALLELLKQPRTDATFQCNSTGHCQFRQKELPIVIAVQCRYGQCESRRRDLPLIASTLPRDPELVDSMFWSHFGVEIALTALAFACCLALLCANRPKIDVDGDVRGIDTQPQLPGVQLRFDAVHYRVNAKRWLLRDVSGRVEPGELLAIIGASGAGKTTLLDILAGWRKSGDAHGTVLVDGVPRDARSFKLISGYVPQEEPFLPTLTVQEQLELTAELTFAPSVGPMARRRRVDEALSDVGLTHVRNTRIGQVVSGGGGERGISGGERRRLSIANQLLSRPRILFCDEPTSGLDAANALAVLQVLQRLARDRKQTVVLSIHQPRHNIFAMFHRLLLLQDGETVYFGPAAKASAHFARLGAHCPSGVNFADFALDTLAAATPQQRVNFRKSAYDQSNDNAIAVDSRERSPQRQHKRHRRRHRSNRRRSKHRSRSRSSNKADVVVSADAAVDVSKLPILRGDGTYVGSSFKRSEYAVSFLTQFNVLAYRSALHTVRTWRLLATHALVAILLALLVGAIYWQRGTGLAGFQDRLGSIFFSLALFAFANLSVLDLFVTERDLFVREREANRYSPFAYYLSKAAVDLPLIRVLPPLVYGLIVYEMIGYREGTIHWIIYLASLTLCSLASSALLYAVGAAVPSVAVGNVIGALLLLFFMLFGGFLLNNGSAPDYVIWLQSVSFFNHAFEAAASNELAGAVFQFDPAGYFSIDVDGQAYLDQLAFSPEMLPTNLAALGGMTALYLLLGYLLLHFIVKSVR
jgi:ABC-type multidrug transport system ATPase subunit/ABC-type multidrug transport system permease subunit